MPASNPKPLQRFLPYLVSLTAVLLLAPMALAEVSETVERTFDLRSGDRLSLENLAGSVEVVGGAERASLVATLHAENAELLDMLELEIDQRNGEIEIEARYPVEEHDKYHYPGLKGTSRTSTRYQGEKVTVSGRTVGAVTAWIDFTLRLPEGVGFEVENAAGNVSLRAVSGPVVVDTGSGHVAVLDGDGPAVIDTGSGHVEISNHRGAIDADTGSGNIRIVGATGSVRADTGSGNVVLEKVEGDSIDADTGSGNVDLDDVRGEIRADTGSGGVVGRNLVVTGRLEADTGSGSVRLEGDFRGATRIGVDTGSGSVELRGDFPGLDIEIDTSSGGIRVDLPDFQVTTRERDHLEGRTGDGRVRLGVDTGSGSVTVEAR